MVKPRPQYARRPEPPATWTGSGRPPQPSTTSAKPCARCGATTSERWWIALGEHDRWVCRDEKACRRRITRERTTPAGR